MNFKRYLFPLLFLFTAASCGESSICIDYQKYYSPILRGKVLNKYKREEGGRLEGYVVLQNYDSQLITLPYFHISNYYDEVNINDSIYKSPNSLLFRIYRNGKFILDINFGGGCSFIKNNTPVSE
jgi:hypothetical protein